MTEAGRIETARRRYSGTITQPDRWATWVPREGDVLVCTPAKCGTTWTQSIVAMLLAGGPDLPGPIPVISPWVDADLGVPADRVAHDLAAQTGRRVVKTHTPGDGYDLWDAVRVIAVYRHPLDVFLSLRSHLANRNRDIGDHPMMQTQDAAFENWLHRDAAFDDLDEDCLSMLVHHYRQTVLSGRIPDLVRLHYADMMRDRAGTVAVLDAALGTGLDAATRTAIVAATGFDSMKDKAENYTPVAGTGFWKSDAGFFASGGTGKWRKALTPEQVARFETRLADLLPEAEARHWLLNGTG